MADPQVELQGSAIRSPVKFALVLAAALLGTVAILNLLGSSEVLVSVDQFQQLRQGGAVERVRVTPSGWHADLRRPCRINSSSGEFLARQILVAGQGRPKPAQLDEWRTAGIAVDFGQDPLAQSSGWRGWSGGVLVSGLLGLGVWHLWNQVRRHRREGSPRQRLEELERDFKQGKLTQEEYTQRAEALWAEM